MTTFSTNRCSATRSGSPQASGLVANSTGTARIRRALAAYAASSTARAAGSAERKRSAGRPLFDQHTNAILKRRLRLSWAKVGVTAIRTEE
jgi:hypothetical protein